MPLVSCASEELHDRLPRPFPVGAPTRGGDRVVLTTGGGGVAHHPERVARTDLRELRPRRRVSRQESPPQGCITHSTRPAERGDGSDGLRSIRCGGSHHERTARRQHAEGARTEAGYSPMPGSGSQRSGAGSSAGCHSGAQEHSTSQRMRQLTPGRMRKVRWRRLFTVKGPKRFETDRPELLTLSRAPRRLRNDFRKIKPTTLTLPAGEGLWSLIDRSRPRGAPKPHAGACLLA